MEISGEVEVTVAQNDQAILAGAEALVIHDGARVTATANTATGNTHWATIQAVSGIGISIGNEVTVTATNTGGGMAMRLTPTFTATGSTTPPAGTIVTASTDASGFPTETYDASNTATYKYLKIETPPVVVDITAIAGVTPPVYGATPVAGITETAQYTGTETWTPNPATFAAGTAYTVTITLTEKSGYTLNGVVQDFFTVAGATLVANTANSGVITADFPATGSTPVVNIAAITGVTAPVYGATPVAGITSTTQYTGTETWTPNHATFAAGTAYTATITLTEESGYTLTGVTSNFFTVSGATTVTNSANSGVITATFPATAAATFGVNIGTFSGGSVSTDKTSAAAGETVTLTITPAAGYTLASLSVWQTASPYTDVSLSGSGNVRTFAMPAYDVTVTATFGANPSANPDAEAVNNAVWNIEHTVFTVPQTTAGSSAAIRAWLADALNNLISSYGISVSSAQITVSGFTAATAGTADSPRGTDGSFRFSVSLSKGGYGSSATNSGVIAATAWTLTGTYAITVVSTNGTVSVSLTSTPAGAVVTLALRPDEGYELESVSAYRTDVASTDVALSGTGLARTFTMPGYAVTVHATFRKTQATLDGEIVESAQTSIEGGVFRVAEVTANDRENLLSWLYNTLRSLFGSTYNFQLRSAEAPIEAEV
jgi:hypothetical protein